VQAGAHPTHPTDPTQERERENLFRWSVLGVSGVLGARQLALPGGAEQPPLHASAAEDLPSPGSARRRHTSDDSLPSMTYSADAAPDRAPAVHVLISIAREREVQPLPHRRNPNTARLPRNACALERAALAAPLLSTDLAIRSSLLLYSLDRECMSEAVVVVGARQLARSWFVIRAGGGRGICVIQLFPPGTSGQMCWLQVNVLDFRSCNVNHCEFGPKSNC